MKLTGVGLYTGSGKDSSAMFEGGKPDPQLAEDLEMLQKEVKQLEIESEHQRQAKKMVVSKWERGRGGGQEGEGKRWAGRVGGCRRRSVEGLWSVGAEGE